jgi:hypothetical protein
MASPAQIAANQQNAKKSTGPRTVEGKRRSSLNALTFGLFSNDIRQLFSDEDRLRYDDFIKIHSDAFLPKGPNEEWLANKIAETMFLLDRAHDPLRALQCGRCAPNWPRVDRTAAQHGAVQEPHAQ